MRYEVAPVTAPQVKVGVLSLVGVPSAGETSVGAGAGSMSTHTVQALLHEPTLPAASTARTRQ